MNTEQLTAYAHEITLWAQDLEAKLRRAHAELNIEQLAIKCDQLRAQMIEGATMKLSPADRERITRAVNARRN